MEPVPGYTYANWELGYGDFHMVPDLTTCGGHLARPHRDRPLRSPRPHSHDLVRWRPGSSSVISWRGPAARATRPRALRSSSTSSTRTATGRPPRSVSGPDPGRLVHRGLSPAAGDPGGVLQRAVRRHLSASGIPVENSKGEWGRGQHEMNIRYTDVLGMADRHTVMKLAMKEIADARCLASPSWPSPRCPRRAPPAIST